MHVAVDAPEHAIDGIVLQRALVVRVAYLRLHDLAQLALLDEVEREHLLLAVGAVLQHHAVAAIALGRLDGRPAFLQVERARHFLQNVLAVIHRIDVDGTVQHPGRRGVHDVAEVRIAKPLPGVLVAVAAPFLRRTVAVLLEPLLVLVEHRGVDVANRRHFASRNLRDAVHGGRSPVAHADEAHAHALHRRHREPVHRRAGGIAQLLAAAHASCGHRRRAHPRGALEEFPSACLHCVSLFWLAFVLGFPILPWDNMIPNSRTSGKYIMRPTGRK